jgi:RNase P subunit RPR2
MLIILAGSVIAYNYYLKEKKEHLDAIHRGFCPICHQNSIEISDQRGGGCGPKIISYTCLNCGYENSFSIDGSCGL